MNLVFTLLAASLLAACATQPGSRNYVNEKVSYYDTSPQPAQPSAYEQQRKADAALQEAQDLVRARANNRPTQQTCTVIGLGGGMYSTTCQRSP